MLTGNPLEALFLHFRRPAPEEVIMEIFREMAAAFQQQSELPEFRRVRLTPLPDNNEPARAREEVLETERTRLEIRIVATGANGREELGYELLYRLTEERGFSLVVEGWSPAPWPQEVVARLNYVWPQHFDEIREIFRRHLGAEDDATDDPHIASLNAEAAFEAGYGAFARHLVDLALEKQRSEPAHTPEEEQWLPRLQELFLDIGRSGPKEHDG